MPSIVATRAEKLVQGHSAPLVSGARKHTRFLTGNLRHNVGQRPTLRLPAWRLPCQSPFRCVNQSAYLQHLSTFQRSCVHQNIRQGPKFNHVQNVGHLRRYAHMFHPHREVKQNQKSSSIMLGTFNHRSADSEPGWRTCCVISARCVVAIMLVRPKGVLR